MPRRTFAKKVREERTDAGDEAQLVQVLYRVLVRRFHECIDHIGSDEDAVAVRGTASNGCACDEDAVAVRGTASNGCGPFPSP